MADQHAGVEAPFSTGEGNKEIPVPGAIFCQENDHSFSSQPTPAQRPAVSEQTSTGTSEVSEQSDLSGINDTTLISEAGVSNNGSTYIAETPVKSSTSRSFESLTSEGSFSDTEASRNVPNHSSAFTGSQTPEKDQGGTTGASVSEDTKAQSGADTSKNRDGNTPPPNVGTVKTSSDQVGPKPDTPYLLHGSVKGRPRSGSPAHARPTGSRKSGTRTGTHNVTGADTGKSSSTRSNDKPNEWPKLPKSATPSRNVVTPPGGPGTRGDCPDTGKSTVRSVETASERPTLSPQPRTPRNSERPFNFTASPFNEGLKAGTKSGTGNKARKGLPFASKGSKHKHTNTLTPSFSQPSSSTIFVDMSMESPLPTPRTPRVQGGKRKRQTTGTSPEVTLTPSKRVTFEPQPISPIKQASPEHNTPLTTKPKNGNSTGDSLTPASYITVKYSEMAAKQPANKQQVRQPSSSASSFTTTASTYRKETGSSGRDQPRPSSKPNKTVTAAETLFTFITINIVRGTLNTHKVQDIFQTFTRYIHPGNIMNQWRPRKNLGPTFLIRKTALSKARNFVQCSGLSFDIKVDQSDVLPKSRNDKGRIFYTKCKPSDAGAPKNNQSSKSSRATTAQQPSKKPFSTGILKNIPISTDMNTLQRKLSSANSNVKNVHRVLNKNRRPTKLVKVTFSCSPAPLILKGDHGNFEVNPCRVPYLRCNHCQKHGHSNKDCKNKQACPICALPHTYNECPSKHLRKAYTCANCGGRHGAAYTGCSHFQTYKEAVDKKNATIQQAWNERRCRKTEAPITIACTLHEESGPLAQANFPALPRPAAMPPCSNNIKMEIIMDEAPQSKPKPEYTAEKAITKADLKRVLCEILTTDIMSRPVEERIDSINKIVDNEFQTQPSNTPVVSSMPQPVETTETIMVEEVDPTPVAEPLPQRVGTPIKTSTPLRGSKVPSSRFKVNDGKRLKQRKRLQNRFSLLGSPCLKQDHTA